MRRQALIPAVLAALVAGLVTAAPASAAAPTITSFTPTSGVIGTQVTITGTGFTAPAQVSIGGGPSGYVSVTSSTKLVASVGADAATGPITVTTGGGSATSSATFTVNPGVFLNPAAGPPTTAVNVRFSGLSPREAADVYLDTTDIALISTDAQGAANSTVTIPASATPGTHWITVVGRHSGLSAQASYLVRTDWPQSDFDADRTGHNPYENVLTTSTVSRLRERWRTPEIGFIESTPAVVGGVVYADFGDGTLRAFSESTGAQKWSFSIGSGADFSSPTVAGGVVYVGSNNGDVWAVNASTGTRKWVTATGGEVDSSPVVSGSTVYVGSDDDNLYALSATTGAVLWKYPTGGAVYSSPTVVSGVVYVSSEDASVYAINAITGKSVWQYPIGGEILASPVVADGLVYVAGFYSGTNVVALYASSGSVAWSAQVGAVVGTPAFDAGVLFVTDDNSNTTAFDAATGAVRWAVTVDAG